MLKKIVLFLIAALIILAGIYFYTRPKVTPSGLMPLTVYIQDKKAAAASNCGITTKKIYDVPPTQAVADASLKILFRDELSSFGTFEFVEISNGTAKVMIKRNFKSLSSCEAQHLISVVNDTLLQYDSVKKVELYSPDGKIEF